MSVFPIQQLFVCFNSLEGVECWDLYEKGKSRESVFSLTISAEGKMFKVAQY